VLLDVSASMQAREPEGVRFDLARARAEREIARLASSDEAMLVTAGARAGVVLRWSTDRTLARRRLEELSALDVPTDLTPALELALSEGRARAGTRILVLTDLPAAESGLAAADLAAVEWKRVGRTDDNVGIVGVSVDEPPFADARAASVLVLVRNFARAPRRVVLAGGGSLLRGVDRVIADNTGLPVHIVKEPLLAVARGTAIYLENLDILKRLRAATP